MSQLLEVVMTVQLDPPVQPVPDFEPAVAICQALDDFDLDISFIEAGGTVEHIIKMTEDNCGNTCQSACTSC
jgi:FxLD family lantipeptide